MSLSACGHNYRDDKVDHSLGLNVEDAAGVPVPGVIAQIWILDADLPGDSQDEIPMGARTTNSEGRAEWTYSAHEAPLLHAFEVRTAGGVVLAQGTAAPRGRLDVVPGEVTVTLAP